jgi:hypothetical protein
MESPCTSNITFTAIKHFVDALVSVFGSGGGKTPLGFYSRLISHVEVKDAAQGVDKYVSGFKTFFTDFGDKINNNEGLLSIPRDTNIKYGDSEKVYIEIQKFIYKSKALPEQLNAIRQHLLTISTTINPDESALVALEKTPVFVNDNTFNIPGGNESGFVKEQMDSIRQTLESGEIDMSDPMNGIMALMQSGVITNMIGKLKDGVDSGALDPNKMLSGLQTTLTDMMKDAGEEGEVDMSQINAIASQVIFNQNFAGMMDAADAQNVEEVEEIDEVD